MEGQIKYFTNHLVNQLVLDSEIQMNSLGIRIPLSYALNLIELNWNDVLFAIQNEYFSKEIVIDYAINLVRNGRDDQEVIDIACLDADEITKEELLQDYIFKLANEVSEEDKEQTQEKLLYVLLCLLYEERSIFEDPLTAIEVVYDDFGCPPIMQGFVRYMQIENENTSATTERYYANWNKYLDNQRQKFALDGYATCQN